MSQREIARRLGISRNTVRKYCTGEVIPDGPVPRKRANSVMTEDVIAVIKGYLESDQEVPGRKQRHTAKRVYDRLRQEEGFTGSYTSVANVVRQLRGRVREAYVPLAWDIGEAAQVDWGTAWVLMQKVRTKCQMFCMRLYHSCMPFVALFPSQKTEFLLEGHRRAFEFFGGVPKRLIYDNMRTAVKEGWGRYVKQKQRGILSLEGHYAYDSEFCRPGHGNDKGLVENLVEWARNNILVPMPRVDSWEELNEVAVATCRAYAGHHISGRPESVGEAFAKEQAYLTPLPARPLDTSKTESAKVQSNGLIRFDNCYYSVPASLVGERVTVKGRAFIVEAYYSGECVASHERKFAANAISYKLEHYLDLLEIRPRSVRQAQPVRQTVCEPIRRFRERLSDDSEGDREFVNILRLVVDYGQEAVLKAIEACLAAGHHSYEAVRFHLLQELQNPEIPPAIPQLDKLGSEVQKVELSAYDELLQAGDVACIRIGN